MHILNEVITMKYDFTSIVDRKGKDAIAVDSFLKRHPECPKEGFDLIPMWVADMNFATAPSIVESMKKRLEHPFFGYFYPRQELIDGTIRWQKERNGHHNSHLRRGEYYKDHHCKCRIK